IYTGYFFSPDQRQWKMLASFRAPRDSGHLRRLIKCWQIVVPLGSVGSKIRIILPSGLAYGIRARSNKIVPNSILVFDIQVVGTRKQVR
ncbi:MAG: FKBP-type peptidyl-prolyl cis-trans isomerase, partial [Bacteroidota bacterium]